MMICDKCDGRGILWVPVGEFGERSELCWKCGGSGDLSPVHFKPGGSE